MLVAAHSAVSMAAFCVGAPALCRPVLACGHMPWWVLSSSVPTSRRLPAGIRYTSTSTPGSGPSHSEPHTAHSSARPGNTSPKKTLLIVYHTLTDGSRQMAQAAHDAAATAAADPASGLEVRMVKASEAVAEDLLSASGYIFAAPENLAAIAGIMKDFFDRTYYAALGKLNGRPYAVFVCAGSDGENALRQMERIATGWRLRRAADGIIACTHAQVPERIFAIKKIERDVLDRCAEVGGALAEGLAMGIF